MTCPIENVVVYTGHESDPVRGPYSANTEKRIGLFRDINPLREKVGKKPWKISTVAGESLVDRLKEVNPKRTLLVIPAGQSSDFDKVFSIAQVTFLQEEYFKKGGRGYFTCGAAYWVSRIRIYNEVCSQQPEKREMLIKESILPLFQGVSNGPLCPFPGHKYKVGFYSDAVEIKSEEESCSVYLSGGGSFILPEKGKQKYRVLARYPHHELHRHKIEKKHFRERENAAVMVSIGEGAAVLAMFHPYYSSRDIDVERYEAAFPDCGTDWRRVHDKLSSFSKRMNFFQKNIMNPLEELNFNAV